MFLPYFGMMSFDTRELVKNPLDNVPSDMSFLPGIHTNPNVENAR